MLRNNLFSTENDNCRVKPVLDKQAFSSKVDSFLRNFSFSNKQKKLNKRFQVSQSFLEPKEIPDITLTEEELETQSLEETYKKQKKETLLLKKEKFIDILCITGCIYFLFLTFGVWVTDYHYNDNGQIAPLSMSYEDIVQKKSFETLLDHYINCRNLYEQALSIDIELANGIEPFTLAPAYEQIVTEAESLYTKTEALSLDAKYEQVRTMMLTWIKNDLATYCKNMSTAISQNNSTVAATALQSRERTSNDFSLITQNIIAIGETINGVDLTNVKEWNSSNMIN